MPIIVSCPKCSGQLRVADDLIGRKVRCPACSTTFEAVEPRGDAGPPRMPEPPLPDLDRPAATEKIDAWKSLNLELDEAKPKPSPPPPPAPPSREDDEPPAPRRPRLNDDHDDLRPCRGCGRMVHRDARRCASCGELLRGGDHEEEDDVRYERRRRKRDWEPHRAGFVLAMGVISVATLFTCWPLTPLAIIPGIMAWVMGSGDLRKIRAGTMDPAGQGSTQAGWICGIIGTVINTLAVLACGLIFSLIWYADIQASKQRQQRPFNVPPPVLRQPR